MHLYERVAQLLDTKRRPEVAAELGISPTRVSNLAAWARKKGIPVRSGNFSRERPGPEIHTDGERCCCGLRLNKPEELEKRRCSGCINGYEYASARRYVG